MKKPIVKVLKVLAALGAVAGAAAWIMRALGIDEVADNEPDINLGFVLDMDDSADAEAEEESEPDDG